jgi:hypothetical protein
VLDDYLIHPLHRLFVVAIKESRSLGIFVDLEKLVSRPGHAQRQCTDLFE